MLKKNLLLFACTFLAMPAFANIPDQTIDLNQIESDTKLTPKQKAEEIAERGERLLMPQSIDYSVAVFKRAIELDPQNERAGFYLALTKPLVTLKGVFSRVEPLILGTKEADFIGDYQNDRSNSWPYLAENPSAPEIKNDADLRKLVVQISSDWSNARSFLAAHNALRMKLNSALNGWYTTPVTKTYTYKAFDHYDKNNPVYRDETASYIYDQSQDGLTLAAKECKVTNSSPGVYHIEECKHLTYNEYSIDEGDVEVFREYASGQQIAAIVATAYNLNGGTAVAAKNSVANHNLERQHGSALVSGPTRITDKEITQILLASGAGPLEQDQKLGEIRSLGVDLLGGVKWLEKMQAKFCPAGQSKEGSRPGTVMSNGICLTDSDFSDNDLHRYMTYVEIALQGGLLDVQNGQGRVSKIQFSRIFDNPVANLVEIAPNKFDDVGNVAGLTDGSMHGIFPDGDADRFYNWK